MTKSGKIWLPARGALTGAAVVMPLVLLAVLMQSFLPAGFMPSIGAGGKTQIVICSGDSEKTITVSDDESPDFSRHSRDTKSKSICAYAVLAAAKVVPALPAVPPIFFIASLFLPVMPKEIAYEGHDILPFPPRGPPVVNQA